MTIQRAPTRDALHCLICNAPGPNLEFDHIKERSTHPQLKDEPTNLAPLCPACHWLKSNKRIKTWVEDGVYCWRRREADVVIRVLVTVDERHKCLVREDAGRSSTAPEDQQELLGGLTSGAVLGAEASEGAPSAGVVSYQPSPRPSAPSHVGAELLPAESSQGGTAGTLGSARQEGRSVDHSAPAPFVIHEWCQRGMALVHQGLRIKHVTDEWRFAVGDWAREGEAGLGEEAYQYLRGFGREALKQYIWVAERVLPNYRVIAQTWSHARAVAALEPEAQQTLLERAQAEGLTAGEVGVLAREQGLSGSTAAPERHPCPSCGAIHAVKG